MDLKLRLQRMLQIVEEVEHVGELADLERDILLNELREAYAELKFGITEETENGKRKTENEGQETENEEQEAKNEVQEVETPIAPITPIAPTTPTEEEQPEEEPEVEVELLFEEETEETENGKRETENEEQETENGKRKTENEEPSKESAEPNEELSSFVSRLSSKKSSPLLSLYEDEPAPVVGEQFCEKPSVADTIACPKGVAESAPVVSLHDAIGVADRFMLIRELFDGDAATYDSAINALENKTSFDDCVIYISENYAWRPQSEATKYVMSLLQRKFN